MIRILIAIGLIVHGLVHLLGFVVPWRLVKLEDMPYRTTILAGKVDLGDAGIRANGLLWLVATIGFVAAGVGLFAMTPWWQGLTLAVTVFSLVLCILGWPDAQFGVYINLVILAYLVFGGRLAWLPQL
jgi:hypothetical protein